MKKYMYVVSVIMATSFLVSNAAEEHIDGKIQELIGRASVAKEKIDSRKQSIMELHARDSETEENLKMAGDFGDLDDYLRGLTAVTPVLRPKSIKVTPSPLPSPKIFPTRTRYFEGPSDPNSNFIARNVHDIGAVWSRLIWPMKNDEEIKEESEKSLISLKKLEAETPKVLFDQLSQEEKLLKFTKILLGAGFVGLGAYKIYTSKDARIWRELLKKGTLTRLKINPTELFSYYLKFKLGYIN